MNEEEEVKFKTVAPEVLEAASKALGNIATRSFSGRHPELGRMIKCQVCGRRHRDSQKCIQVFTTKWFEEDLETGIVEPIFATAMSHDQKPTKRQVVSAVAFKAKRLKPHLNSIKLRIVERTREIFYKLGFTENVPPEVFQNNMKIAREAAELQLWVEHKQKAKKYRRQQDRSRRINRGLI
jgi:hypothetical protein